MNACTNIKSYFHFTMLCLVPVAIMGLFAATAHSSDNQPKIKNIDTLTVFDSHKKKVGQVGPFPTGCFGGSAVAYETKGRKFSVGLNKTGFIKCKGYYYFESTDCSGTPYVQVDTSALIESARVGEPGSTVYLPKLDEYRQAMEFHSLLNEQFEPFCNTVDNVVNAAPETPIINLDTVFTPPFEVR
jgi:hypothetical protein